jgi:hypothetical protein
MTSTIPLTGEQRRDAALTVVLDHIPPGDPWRADATRLIGRLASDHVVFEAYDLIKAGLTEPDHPSRWGAVFSHCAKAGLIELVGYGPSSRPTVKSSAVRFWRGAQ